MKAKTRTSLLLALIALAVFACASLLVACDSDSSVDKTDLSTRIEYVEANYASNDDETYTEDSYSALTEALAAAKSVNSDEKATQEKVDEALKNLNDAIDGLQKTFERAYNIDYLSEFVADIAFNYTLNVTDYRTETPKEYKSYYTDGARYYENTETGLVSYDGYVHSWTYDEDNVVMGRVYFKSDATPMVYLYGDEMSRIIRSLGNVEEYEIWGSASFANLKNTNVYVSTEEVYIETFFEVATGEQINDEIAGLFGGVSLEILQQDETETLKVTLYGEHYLDPVIVYTVTEIGETSLDKVTEYVEQNPEYTTSVAVTDLLDYFYDEYWWEDAVQFAVYTQGMDTPDYTVTAVDLDNNYWYSTKSNKALINLSAAKLTEAQLAEGKLTFGQEASFNKYAVSFYTYVIEKRENYINLAGTDEYFIDLTANSTVRDFVIRFFDVDVYESTLITKVSVTLNENGNLVFTLWEDYNGTKSWDGVILRAVLVANSYDGDDVKVQEIEDYFVELESLEALQKTLAKAEAIDGALYTAESYAVLQNAITAAQAVINNDDRTNDDITQANTAITVAISGLVERISQGSRAALENVVLKAGLYTQEKYTADSYAALQSAVNTAEALLEDDNASAQQVQQSVAAVSDAIDNLVLSVDKSALAARIAQLSAEELTGYTQASKTAFQTALTDAQNVSASEESTQSQVNAALNTLNTAFASLELLSTDQTALQASYDEKSSVNNDDGTYTADSYAAFDAVRSLVSAALSDSDLSDSDCNALLKMLNGRYNELEVEGATHAASSAITAFINNGSSYSLTDESGVTENIIIKTNTYYYNDIKNTGFVLFESLMYTFTIENGKVVLGDPCAKAGSYLSTNISQVGINSPFSYFRGTLTRIGNSDEWFTTDTSRLAFLSVSLEGVYGYSLQLDGESLIIKIYAGKDLVSGQSAAGRTDVLYTFTLEKLTTSSVAVVDEFLADSASRATAADIVANFQSVSDNYTIVDIVYGTQIVRTANYYFNGTQGYILKDGTVHELFYIEGQYKIGGVVYVNDVAATSIDQLVPSFAQLKALTENDFDTYYDEHNEVYKYYYSVVDGNGDNDQDLNDLMAQIAGLEPDDSGNYSDMSIRPSDNGTIYFAEGDVSFRPDTIYAVKNIGTTQVEEIEALLA